ncbi:16S rRNA (guanine(527)-N(7))-methyltransferase RsmG [Massilia sp. TS11]|uniref:16S rRNA (guanine(527)-N(7))-methyltransferase RsmG n=1 Tax=Massilia sp. TS11 TaxID=2908003 RepID=UPI001EDC72EF|nr:16S rRNA (guanine(527)-N(7))-methyltransferase RsmG [Massilia sp. TS11]MCG2585232.1 16S rRNA (guanine(527)-N(7))-methyltransferase RsmG [Massilia sp. TS11]
MKGFDRVILGQILVDGLAELNITLSPSQREQLLDYLALLHKWNAVYNLTAVRAPLDMIRLHILDSLAAVPAFQDAHNVLDVGAGGGLPGIVLAICRPDMKVTLIDTVHKKTAFLTQVKAQLKLANVSVVTGRVEQYQPSDKFDVITSRAFADLSDFVNWSQHLLASGGRYIALKGTAPKDEQERVPSDWKIKGLQPLRVPGLDVERHLVFIERSV